MIPRRRIGIFITEQMAKSEHIERREKHNEEGDFAVIRRSTPFSPLSCDIEHFDLVETFGKMPDIEKAYKDLGVEVVNVERGARRHEPEAPKKPASPHRPSGRHK